MVGVFGTMAADVLHVGFGVPYVVSATLYAAVLAAVFILWYRTEHTLSIHSIDTPRREAFYWAAVVATFAMGTAVGDFAAVTLGLGYFTSMLLFAVIILVPAAGYRWLHWNPILAFWFAYVITRPLGASFAGSGMWQPGGRRRARVRQRAGEHRLGGRHRRPRRLPFRQPNRHPATDSRNRRDRLTAGPLRPTLAAVPACPWIRLARLSAVPQSRTTTVLIVDRGSHVRSDRSWRPQ